MTTKISVTFDFLGFKNILMNIYIYIYIVEVLIIIIFESDAVKKDMHCVGENSERTLTLR